MVKEEKIVLNKLVGHESDHISQLYFIFQPANNNTQGLDLFVSYKSQPFVPAQFDTDLGRRDYHVADVSYDRIFVAVSHTETLVNLYISEMIDHHGAKFILSLPNILTFFPNNTWKDSWLR